MAKFYLSLQVSSYFRTGIGSGQKDCAICKYQQSKIFNFVCGSNGMLTVLSRSWETMMIPFHCRISSFFMTTEVIDFSGL